LYEEDDHGRSKIHIRSFRKFFFTQTLRPLERKITEALMGTSCSLTEHTGEIRKTRWLKQLNHKAAINDEDVRQWALKTWKLNEKIQWQNKVWLD